MEFKIDKYHLKSDSLFDSLLKDELFTMNSKMSRKEYLKGEYLFKENSYSKGIYVVKRQSKNISDDW